MFPFCAEDCDVVGICCHIDEEHAVEVKNGKFQGFLHAAAMTVRAKFIELFLNLKSKIGEHVRVHGLVLSQTFPCSLPRISFFQICNHWSGMCSLLCWILMRLWFTLIGGYAFTVEGIVYTITKRDSKLSRNLSKILYVNGHALESSLQPKNCIPVKPWKLGADEQRSYSISEFQVG